LHEATVVQRVGRYAAVGERGQRMCELGVHAEEGGGAEADPAEAGFGTGAKVGEEGEEVMTLGEVARADVGPEDCWVEGSVGDQERCL
tara:strand:+ start:13540 stop:13803 length:264 start_codon:yes stop_codon:yes gene_type:complete